MEAALLDTDTISEILRRRNPTVEQNATKYLKEHTAFSFSAITHYEIVRGLIWKEASRQLVAYRDFAASCVIVPLTEDAFEQAARLWAVGQRAGKPNRDADLIIAATAIIQGRTLVTGNTSHFDWIEGLDIVNWRESLE